MEDPASVFDCFGMIFTVLKLALALSPIIVLASLFVFNTDTEEVYQTKRKPDFSLEPLENILLKKADLETTWSEITGSVCLAAKAGDWMTFFVRFGIQVSSTNHVTQLHEAGTDMVLGFCGTT
ncbi:hypothetical protein TGRH88_021230 [Toxoplasma gondii]|nr:hypothetical protein TGRH88_021230 [Toxoplasma gondii]